MIKKEKPCGKQGFKINTNQNTSIDNLKILSSPREMIDSFNDFAKFIESSNFVLSLKRETLKKQPEKYNLIIKILKALIVASCRFFDGRRKFELLDKNEEVSLWQISSPIKEDF